VSASRPLNPWPWAVAALLSVVVGVNLYVFALARRNAPVLAEEAYYQLGLDHQARIDARRASRALGWRAAYAWEPARLTLTLVDASGVGVEGLEGSLRLRRADTALDDAQVSLSPLGGGRYEAALPPRLGGLYSFRASLARGGVAWEEEGHARLAAQGQAQGPQVNSAAAGAP
jgi:nitrogen fixation protein FixH